MRGVRVVAISIFLFAATGATANVTTPAADNVNPTAAKSGTGTLKTFKEVRAVVVDDKNASTPTSGVQSAVQGPVAGQGFQGQVQNAFGATQQGQQAQFGQQGQVVQGQQSQFGQQGQLAQNQQNQYAQNQQNQYAQNQQNQFAQNQQNQFAQNQLAQQAQFAQQGAGAFGVQQGGVKGAVNFGQAMGAQNAFQGGFDAVKGVTGTLYSQSGQQPFAGQVGQGSGLATTAYPSLLSTEAKSRAEANNLPSNVQIAGPNTAPFGIGAAGGDVPYSPAASFYSQPSFLPQSNVAQPSFGPSALPAGFSSAASNQHQSPGMSLLNQLLGPGPKQCQNAKLLQGVVVCLPAKYAFKKQIDERNALEACKYANIFEKCLDSVLLFSECTAQAFEATAWGSDHQDIVNYVKACPQHTCGSALSGQEQRQPATAIVAAKTGFQQNQVLPQNQLQAPGFQGPSGPFPSLMYPQALPQPAVKSPMLFQGSR